MFLILGAIGPSGGGKTTLLRVLAPPSGNPKPVEPTADVVFSTLDLPTGRVATIDTPGATAHRTSAMIGVLAMDLALVCVSAVDGVTDEFKATLAMLAVLPVVGTVVAITKIDLIEPEDRDDVMRKVREACGHEVRIVAVSATSGEGIESLRRVLSSTVERTKIDRQDARRPWLLPVDRVFVLKDTGLIVSGTVAQGVLSAGVTGMVLPGKVSVRVRELRVGGEPVAEASRGQRVAIQMDGASTDLVRRGTLMAPLGAAYESKLVHAKVEWLAPPQSGERVRVYLGADALSGRLFLSDETPDLVQFRLERTTGIANDLPILVAREPSGEMLGGGRVSVLPVRTAQKAPVVVPKGAPRDQVLSVLAGEVHGVSTDEICRRLDVQPQALGNLFEDLLREGTVLGFAGLWYEPTAFGVARDQFQVALLAVHRETPSSPTIAPEAVAAKAGLPWDGKPLDRILGHLAQAGVIERHGEMIRQRTFGVKLKPRQRALLDRVLHCLTAEPINTPHAHDMARTLGIPPPAVEEILRIGIEIGEVVALADGVLYTPEQIDNLRGRISEIADGKPFAMTDMRDALGTTRKYVMPLLEYFDAAGITVRDGDQRTLTA